MQKGRLMTPLVMGFECLGTVASGWFGKLA